MKTSLSTLFLSLCFTAISLSVAAQIPPLSEQYQSQPERRQPAFRVVLEPLHKALLSAQIESPVVKITKRMGEGFNEGDLLIQLDDGLFKAELNRANANSARAKTELESKQLLFNDHVASLFEIKEAEANVAIAEAEVAKAKKNFDSTRIIAPYKGKVVSLGIEEYELAQVGKILMEIVEDQTLLANLLLPSSMLQQLQIGQRITITIKETGEPINAMVTRIGSVIDPSSSTIRVEAEVDNREGKYKAGMSGTATLGVNQS